MVSSDKSFSANVLLRVARPKDAREGALSAGPWMSLITMSLAAALATLAIGWVAVVLPLLIAWSTSPATNVVETFTFGTLFWFSAHGVPLVVSGIPVTLIPTGVSLLIGSVLALGAAITARQGVENELSRRKMVVWAAAFLATGGFYTAIVWLILAIVGFPGQLVRSLLGVAILGLVSAMLGAYLGVGRPVGKPIIHGLIRGTKTGLATIGLGSGLALAAGLVLQTDRIATLERGLGLDTLGSFLLGWMYLAYLPTMLVWSGSYILGGGFALGTDSFMAPGATHAGVLPTIPVFGVVTDSIDPSTWAWLGFAIAAALLSAWLTIRAIPDSTVVWSVSLWAAIGAGTTYLVWFGLAMLTRGDLGLQRLVGFGPRPFELLILGPPLFVGLGALLGFLVVMRRRVRAAAVVSAEIVPTVVSESVDPGAVTVPVADESLATTETLTTAQAAIGDETATQSEVSSLDEITVELDLRPSDD